MKIKNNIWFYTLITLIALILSNSCKKDSTEEQTPTVETSEVTAITHTTAGCGGNILSDGGSTIISRGICWSTGLTPTITDSKTTDGIGVGVFSNSIIGLTAGTTYYVRAYATNSSGTG